MPHRASDGSRTFYSRLPSPSEEDEHSSPESPSRLDRASSDHRNGLVHRLQVGISPGMPCFQTRSVMSNTTALYGTRVT